MGRCCAKHVRPCEEAGRDHLALGERKRWPGIAGAVGLCSKVTVTDCLLLRRRRAQGWVCLIAHLLAAVCTAPWRCCSSAAGSTIDGTCGLAGASGYVHA